MKKIKFIPILLAFFFSCIQLYSQNYILETSNFTLNDSVFYENLKKEQVQILMIDSSNEDGSHRINFISYKTIHFDSIYVGFWKRKLYNFSFYLSDKKYFSDFKDYCDKNLKFKGKSGTEYDSSLTIWSLGYKYKHEYLKMHIRVFKNDSTFDIILSNSKNAPKR